MMASASMVTVPIPPISSMSAAMPVISIPVTIAMFVISTAAAAPTTMLATMMVGPAASLTAATFVMSALLDRHLAAILLFLPLLVVDKVVEDGSRMTVGVHDAQHLKLVEYYYILLLL